MADLFAKDIDVASTERWNATAAAFLHRPYRRMAETGLAASYLLALARGGEAGCAQLAEIAQAAGVAPAALIAELHECPHLYDLVGETTAEPYPATLETLRSLRTHPLYQRQVLDKMRFGDSAMHECGNLYTASMPGWLAAGLEEAATGTSLDGASILAFGYGSGDAAEVVPMTLVDGWQVHARRIGFAAALTGAVDLDQARYQQLHDSLELDNAVEPRPSTFVIERVGCAQSRDRGALDDRGIEYYRFVQ